MCQFLAKQINYFALWWEKKFLLYYITLKIQSTLFFVIVKAFFVWLSFALTSKSQNEWITKSQVLFSNDKKVNFFFYWLKKRFSFSCFAFQVGCYERFYIEKRFGFDDSRHGKNWSVHSLKNKTNKIWFLESFPFGIFRLKQNMSSHFITCVACVWLGGSGRVKKESFTVSDYLKHDTIQRKVFRYFF